MPYHEPPHCLSYTRCPTSHHICHSQGEFRGTSVGLCILQSGGQIVAALVICDWLVFWVRCHMASTLFYTYSQSGYWSKDHSENRNRPYKWRLTTKCNQLLYLLECKMRVLPEIWCLNMWGRLKFIDECQSGPYQTGSLQTGPCRPKPRPALPNHPIRSALLWDIQQHRVVLPYWHFGTTSGPHLQRSRNAQERTEHGWS